MAYFQVVVKDPVLENIDKPNRFFRWAVFRFAGRSHAKAVQYHYS